jgi:hypothetical protein
MLHSIESPEFVRSMRRLLDFPDGLPRAEIVRSLIDSRLVDQSFTNGSPSISRRSSARKGGSLPTVREADWRP